MQSTKEQKKIVQYNLDNDQILKVVALAGTGKTTTLEKYAEARPSKRFLYVAFNKSVQVEAEAKFPNNVTCKTAHGLAWPGFGNKHRDRLMSGFKANTVKKALDLKKYVTAKFTIDTLINYLISDDVKVKKKHIPSAARQYYRDLKRKKIPDFVDMANYLRRLMYNGSDKRIGMLHDGYLKLYQLSRPVLPYDVILLDEAQDINPVIADFVLRQHAPIIMVGDSHQQIYSFRGAQDVMGQVEDDKTMYLTQSFRFDNNIARVANMILRTFKREKKKVVGLRPKMASSFRMGFTFLARTNAGVFSEAVKWHSKFKLAFVGGINGYRMNQIFDLFYLYNGQNDRIHDSYIRSFSDYDRLRDFARNAEDWEILSKCRVVEEYGKRIPGLVKKIRKAAVEPSRANILLSTVHKAKGLEWNNVHIASDFPDLIENGNFVGQEDLDPDEFNLIYVAVTRSMGGLRFNDDSSIREFILKAKKIA
ncbi:UvrD-helicase domain-containing protein [Thermodesulfobacteriota bacterium]